MKYLPAVMEALHRDQNSEIFLFCEAYGLNENDLQEVH